MDVRSFSVAKRVVGPGLVWDVEADGDRQVFIDEETVIVAPVTDRTSVPHLHSFVLTHLTLWFHCLLRAGYR